MSVWEWQLKDVGLRGLQDHVVDGVLQQIFETRTFFGGVVDRIIVHQTKRLRFIGRNPARLTRVIPLSGALFQGSLYPL